MTKLADRVLQMEEAATLKMAQLARDLQAEGKNIISLTVGEPDFDTPERIRQAAKDALDQGYTRYTPVNGIMESRKAVCEKLRRENGLEYSPAQIVLSTGAKQSIMNACLALINPGDEVILLAPFWVSYTEMVKMAGGVPRIVKCGIEADFKVSPAQLEAAITDRTKVMLINSPSNPTGAVYSREELEAIAAIVARHPDLYVISDEIYEHIIFGGAEHVSFASLPGMWERTITVNGLSKGFAMTGWRLGYLAAPEWIAAAVTKVQGQFTSGPNAVTQVALQTALDGDLSESHHMRDVYERRKAMVRDLLLEIPGLKVNDPQGAFYIFPDASAYIDGQKIKNSDDLGEYFLTQAAVAVVPGSAFGDDAAFRISCAASDEELRTGVARIADALSLLRTGGG
ncbi:MAG TPA: pyridoxal phosphate-dependent aminotransferase [Sphingobium sp.]|nr:pyridoxal phosphate-dependent aminotransferase [Sphingobium sp.]